MQQQNYQDITLERLAKFERNDLLKYWKFTYDADPPTSISRPLLLHAIAYKLQEKALGGLKRTTRRYMLQLVADNETAILPRTNVRTGTRLLREWHGVTHEVLMQDDGVMFKSKRYRSLSEVAFAITGNKWSGPLFFGLRKKSHG